MNSAAFGGVEARAALQKSLFDDEQQHVGIDWCVGGCKPYEESEEGRQRLVVLRRKLEEWQTANPDEWAKLKAQLKST